MLSRKFYALQEELRVVRERNVSLEEELARVRRDLHGASVAVVNGNARIKELQEEGRAHELEETHLRDELRALQSRADQQGLELAAARRDLRAAQLDVTRLEEKCEVLEAKNTETRRELTARISQARQTQQMVRELETSQQRDARTFQRGNRTLLGEISKLNGKLKQIEGLEQQLN